MRSLVLASLALCSCAEPPRPLSSFREATLTINAEPGLTVRVTAADGCRELAEGATATVDGTAMPQVTAGGTAPGLGPLLPACHSPTFELTSFAADEGVRSRIVVSDSSATFAAEVTSPGVARPIIFLGGDGGTVQAGVPATLVWPHADESLRPEWTTVSFLPADAGLSSIVQSSELEFSGTRVSFTVPALPLGPVKVTVHTSSIRLSACEGASTCILHSGAGELQATVVR